MKQSKPISYGDTALVVVDMLYDFIDGSLACLNAKPAVKATLAFIEKAVEAIKLGQAEDEAGISNSYPILFICDRHPADHCSFAANGGTWPSHCVMGTHGSEIHEVLKPYVREELTFLKGCDKDREQYSGFEGVNPSGQTLGEILELLDVGKVYVCGIATEFCVKNTCEDLLKAGFKVRLLKDCLAWVEPEGHLRAIEQMRAEGIAVI